MDRTTSAAGAEAGLTSNPTLKNSPPGITDTNIWPAVAISAAEIRAINRSLLTKVVGRLLPFHRIMDAVEKFVPVTSIGNPSSPALALPGNINDSWGGRLGADEGATVNT